MTAALAADGRAERPGDAPADGWPPGFASSPSDGDALLVLMGLASLTPRRLLDLAAVHGTAVACLAAVRAGVSGSARDVERARSTDPHDVREAVMSAEARLVVVGDEEYPADLDDLADPPAGLFVRGRDLREDPVRVAVVGARNCSEGGREIGAALARALALAGAAVVSGAARGIDSAAHRGALAAGGATVAVLGSGIDVAYPRHHGGLLEQICRSGSVVSEYPPGTPVHGFRFPARNRIVAGLSRAVVVVEGAADSGSMITADHALDLGREVLAVPGPITSELHQAPLALIRDGATLIRGADDLLADLGLAATDLGPADRGSRSAGSGSNLGATERAAWRALATPLTPDRVAERAGIALPAALAALSALEVRGMVRSVGGRFERRLTG